VRRFLPIRRVAALTALAVLAVGCSSKAKSAPSSATAPATASSSTASPTASASPVAIESNATASASVSGAFGTAPAIKLVGSKPPTTTQVSIVSRGAGPALKAGDLAVVDDYGITWRSSTPFQNTFTKTAPPDTLPVGTGRLGLLGLDRALVGVPAGSRVLVILPPNAGFGAVATPPTGVVKTDTALVVFDVRAGFAGNAGPTGKSVSSGGGTLPTVSGDLQSKPVLAIPKTAAPTKLSTTTLVQGSGPVTAAGDEVVVQYLGQIWATGKEFDSSWSHGNPGAFQVGVGQLISGWDKSLVGVKVGSRVLIVVPPADGYGSTGQSSAGISGTDTLVFVVDVLATYPR
jgi:peptidylprolyl isomerase